VDSGLFGALGMAGCCGPRRSGHARHRRHKVRPEDANSSPSTLPLSRPTAPYADVTPTPSTPPSVLRPENVQPYKEESDDETGYIMGAWQPFPRPGYTSVNEPPRSPEVPKSGFARVGGGRAHYESPYAITQSSGSGRFATGSTQTFPSVERKDTGGTSAHEYSPPPTPSIASVAKRAPEISSLPPGAMPPAHIRTKSQTAIIEDASAVAALGYRPQALGGSSQPNDDDGDDDDHLTAYPRKKHWYHLRKPRISNERESAVPEAPPPEPEPSPAPGRSFVVVRKSRPGTASSTEPTPTQREFTVLRGPDARS